jgi:predicted xylose isomerase-like sugar epimerase
MDYEIHFLKKDCKHAVRVKTTDMSTIDAWKSAILSSGGNRKEVLQIVCLAQVVSLADKHGITSVRWNKAIHLNSWTQQQQSKAESSLVGLNEIDDLI